MLRTHKHQISGSPRQVAWAQGYVMRWRPGMLAAQSERGGWSSRCWWVIGKIEFFAGLAAEYNACYEERYKKLDRIGRIRFGKINTASIPTRYPEDLQSALKDYPEPVAHEYLRQTQELIQWLKQHPNLSKSSSVTASN